MGSIAKLELPNGVVGYMNAVDDPVESATSPQPPGSPVSHRQSADGAEGIEDRLIDAATAKAEALTGVIKGIAQMIPTAFEHAGGAEVEKVTLSFSIKAGGKAGIPLVTEGSAEGSIGVVLECRYPKTTATAEPADG